MIPLPKIGDRHGKLAVRLVYPDANGGSSCLFRCDCGRLVLLRSCHVFGARPAYAACNVNGCRQVNIKHGSKCGGRPTPEYRVWYAMIQRCTNPKAKSYRRYGGRGIKVCSQWMKFENFIQDMGPRPDPTMMIERGDNDGDYKPTNCVWATRIEQANNTRTNRKITANGITMTVAEWGRKMGVNPDFFHGRLGAGWSEERTINEPKHKR